MNTRTHAIHHPPSGVGRRHHPENPAGPPVRGREEAAGGRRDGDAERRRFLGVREAGLAVSCAHFFPAVSHSQFVNRSCRPFLYLLPRDADGVSLCGWLNRRFYCCLLVLNVRGLIAHKTLGGGVSYLISTAMPPPLSLFVANNRCMFRGLAYRFLAENAWTKDEYGVGLAYMMQVYLCRQEYRLNTGIF